jgi:predicted MFS family arabinose efflux permease
MMVLGVGGMIGGYVIGYINDHAGGGKAVAIANIVITIISYFILIIFNSIHEFNFLGYIAAFMSGFLNNCLITQANLILGFEFKTNTEPFAVYRLVSSLTVSMITLVQSGVTTTPRFFTYFLFCCAFNLFS